MLKSYIKKWSDFSLSAIKPLFWMLIGPSLILLNIPLLLPKSGSLFLPYLSTFSLLLIWRWRLSGFCLSLLIFIGYFFTQLFLSSEGFPIWRLIWGCSFALSLTISFLSIEELKKFYFNLKKQGDESIAHLKLSLETLREKSASEKRLIEVEIEKLQKKLQISHDEISIFKQLVQASDIEAKKAHKQNEILSIESLKQNRQVKILQLRNDEYLEKFKNAQEEQTKLTKQNQHRLKELNQLRTEYAQMRLLFDAGQANFQKFHSVILAQKKQLKDLSKSSVDRSNLKTLEQDKIHIKTVYESMQKDYEKLRDLLKEAQSKKGRDSQNLKNQVTHKKQQIEQTKSELVSIEREIFVLKKGMQQAGLEVS